MSTSVVKALPGKLDIKRHLPSILYFSDKQSKSLIYSFLSSFMLRILTESGVKIMGGGGGGEEVTDVVETVRRLRFE